MAASAESGEGEEGRAKRLIGGQVDRPTRNNAEAEGQASEVVRRIGRVETTAYDRKERARAQIGTE
jgi:hypothetical protein